MAKQASLHDWYFTRRILNRINRNIETLGFSAAFARVLDSLGKKIDIQRHPDALQTLNEDPVLLITNHPAEFDAMVLLGSLPYRKDIFMIINNVFEALLPAFAPHSIPIHVNYRRIEGSVRKTFRSKILERIHYNPVLSKEEAKIKNRESISISASRINDGGVILLAPGYGNQDKEFKIGLGYILNALNLENNPKIIMTHISGTSKKDYLRAFPIIRFLLPRFRIVYSGPEEAEKFISGKPKEDTKTLQDHYFDWVNTTIIPGLKKKKPVIYP